MRTDTLIDIEYNQDISEYRTKFANVDRNNHTSLRTWFESHPYLTVNDMARIAGVCHRTINKWRRLAGYVPQKQIKQPKPPTVKKQQMQDVPATITTEWLIAKYRDGYSIPQLAVAAGKTTTAIVARFKRKKIKLRNPKEAWKSSNKCCTLAWCFEHYVQKRMSQSACAKLAGVSRSTFSTWLDKFKIRVRTGTEQLTLK